MSVPAHPLCLIGSGSWATALASLLLNNNIAFNWVVRRPKDAETLQATGRNPRYLKAIQLPTARVSATADIHAAVAAAEHVMVVAPAKHLAAALGALAPDALANKRLTTAIKGLESGSGHPPQAYFESQFDVPLDAYSAILGPGHAEELAQQQLTYLTAVSNNAELRDTLKQMLSAAFVRVSASDDVQGAELAAVLKNVYAIACGIAAGLGYGDNFQSILVSAAAREMEALLAAHLPQTRNIGEAIYLGDLLVTAYSQHSRNRRLGYGVGQGTPAEAQGMVAEGFHSVQQLVEVHAYEAPIVRAVYRILHQGEAARETFRALEADLR